MYNNVDSFLGKLHEIAPKSNNQNFERKKPLEKLFLNNKNTFGRYQVLPMNSVISDYPFVSLPGTREINMPRKNISSDGQETVYEAWIRLLPKSAYTMREPSTGHEVSSLTAAQEQLLDQAHQVFDELYNELDAKNNISDPTVYKLVRKRNYSIFHAYCINAWLNGDMRKPARQNFSALFVLTSKAFLTRIEENISETSVTSGLGLDSWIGTIYNRELANRRGYLMFTVNKGDAPGFNISLSHQLNSENLLAGVQIPAEDAELMSSPVESFLGWQAERNENVPVDQKCLFNKNLITQAIEYMTDQLAKIRITKQSGGNIADAIKATNEKILGTQAPTNTRGQETNDPILAQQARQVADVGNRNQAMNPSAVTEKNDNPFQTPPAAHMDPVTSKPVYDSNSSFGGGWGTNNNNPNGLPF